VLLPEHLLLSAMSDETESKIGVLKRRLVLARDGFDRAMSTQIALTVNEVLANTKEIKAVLTAVNSKATTKVPLYRRESNWTHYGSS